MTTTLVFKKKHEDKVLSFSKTFDYLIPLYKGQQCDLFSFPMQVTEQTFRVAVGNGKKDKHNWRIVCENLTSNWSLDEIEVLKNNGWHQTEFPCK